MCASQRLCFTLKLTSIALTCPELKNCRVGILQIITREIFKYICAPPPRDHIGLKLNIWMVVVSRASVKGRNYDRVGNSEVALEVEKAGDG